MYRRTTVGTVATFTHELKHGGRRAKDVIPGTDYTHCVCLKSRRGGASGGYLEAEMGGESPILSFRWGASSYRENTLVFANDVCVVDREIVRKVDGAPGGTQPIKLKARVDYGSVSFHGKNDLGVLVR